MTIAATTGEALIEMGINDPALTLDAQDGQGRAVLWTMNLADEF